MALASAGLARCACGVACAPIAAVPMTASARHEARKIRRFAARAAFEDVSSIHHLFSKIRRRTDAGLQEPKGAYGPPEGAEFGRS
jgi:hypothetical protein